jgi:lipid-A-disaccharide synthase
MRQVSRSRSARPRKVTACRHRRIYTGGRLPAKVRLLVSCGEPSGDLYGGELVRCLRRSADGLEVFGLGGDRLAEEGATLVAHVRSLAVVGLLEVVRHLGRLRGIFHRLLAEVDRAPPDLAVLVDYPDFNLRLARELHRRGVKVAYYVSPQVWAWRRGRLRAIRETVACMLVIFPFEEELYQKAGVPVRFVGHPLVDLVRPTVDRTAFLAGLGLDPGRPVVAILPGSRPQEIAHNLPPLAGALRMLGARRPDLQFVLAVAPSLELPALSRHLRGLPISVVKDETHAALASAAVALVASGTATVEAALLGTPMVVVYRLSPITYALGRPFVRVPHYAMANLIAAKRVVPELIQGDFTPARVAEEALSLLQDEVRAARMRDELLEVRRRLGGPGASGRAAAAVRELLASPQKKP